MAAFPECLLTCIFVLGVQQCLLASFPSAKHCLCECFSYSQRPAMRQVAAFCNYKHLFRCAFSLSLFLSLSPFLSLSGYFFGVQRLSEFTLLPGLLRPFREGALCLHPTERAPETSVNRASPVQGLYWLSA